MKPFFTSLFEIRFQAAALLLALIALSVTDVQGQLIIGEVVLSVSPHSVGESASETLVEVTGTLVDVSSRLFGSVKVMVIVGNKEDSATEHTDFLRVPPFELTIKAGEITGKNEFTLIPLPDDIVEYDETVSVSGTAEAYLVGGVVLPTLPVGLLVRPTTVTIEDDDDITVSLSVSPHEVAEAGGPEIVTVTAVLNIGEVDGVTTVAVTVGSHLDSATEDTDFVRVPPFELTIKADEITGKNPSSR